VSDEDLRRASSHLFAHPYSHRLFTGERRRASSHLCTPHSHTHSYRLFTGERRGPPSRHPRRAHQTRQPARRRRPRAGASQLPRQRQPRQKVGAARRVARRPWCWGRATKWPSANIRRRRARERGGACGRTCDLRTAPMRGLVEEVCVESRIQVVVMLVGICRALNVMLCYGWFTQPTPTTHPPGTRAASFWGRT
jgi:hypothetical protein